MLSYLAFPGYVAGQRRWKKNVYFGRKRRGTIVAGVGEELGRIIVIGTTSMQQSIKNSALSNTLRALHA